MTYKTFNPISFSSKIGICGLPIRLDTYKTCGFQCKYCFSNGNAFGTKNNATEIGSARAVQMRLNKIFVRQEKEKFSFIDYLIANNYTWHCGGMSDPFQPLEQAIQATKKIIDITNNFNIHILFSTKSDTYYDTNVNPNLHNFQLSVTNINDRVDIEPNVPAIKSRLKFFYKLKEQGFKVGIRIQPFIPNISTLDIIKQFINADHFILESIKAVPGNWQHRKDILDISNLSDKNFIRKGLMNVDPKLKLQWYEPFISFFKENNLSYSIADNDLHYLGNNKCCCGDALCFNGATPFNNTNLLHTIGLNYTLDDVLKSIEQENLSDCTFTQHFNRAGQGRYTLNNYFIEKFSSSKNPLSPKFLYINKIKNNK